MTAVSQTDAFASAEGRPFPYFNRLWLNILALALADGIALSCAIGLGEWIRAWIRGEAMTMGWSWGIIPIWWLGAASMRMMPDWGIGPVEHLRRIVTLLTIIFGGVAAVLFLSKIGTMASRLTYTAIFLLSVLLVPLVRVWMKDELLRIRKWGVPVVVYGSDESVTHIVEALRNEAGLGYYPIGNFGDQSGVGGTVAGIPVLGGISDTTSQAVVAIVTKIKGSVQKEIRLIEGPLSTYRRVVVIPDLLEAPSLWVTPRDFLGVLGLELTNNLLNPWARALKRVTDVVCILAFAPLWVPLVGLIALLIWKQDKASPFFLQERTGYRGKVFKTIKLRTMLPNAEAELRRVMEQEPGLAEEWENSFKLKKDPRITRLGLFLRKTSLDELPQLINVLKGDMSLVGPRPLPGYHEDTLSERVRKQREYVRPGITGLWQVSGRSDAGTAGMDRWDSYYVRNWSIWLDIVILVRTFRAVARGRGAY